MSADAKRAEYEQMLIKNFKYLNRFMLLMWRVGLGKPLNMMPATLGRFMVITHIGRKSGLKRYAPVNYTMIDEDIYCTAGFGAQSQWYKNIQANPNVEVWLPDGWWAGVAEDVTDHPDRREILRAVLVASGFAAKLFEGIDIHAITDDELDAITKDYRLLRIRRTEARTGSDGPGEYAWVWPLATLVLLYLLWRRR